MISIDTRSPVAIFEQIKSGFRGLVARGLLKPGDQVPAIRNLAQTLLINPNTIARAYRELIQEGLFESRRGEGNFISTSATRRIGNGLETARKQLVEAIAHSRRSGLNWKDIQTAIQEAKGEES